MTIIVFGGDDDGDKSTCFRSRWKSPRTDTQKWRNKIIYEDIKVSVADSVTLSFPMVSMAPWHSKIKNPLTRREILSANGFRHPSPSPVQGPKW